ncbi:MAG: hypothetical protein IKA73_03960 [Alphaproteobacteria bacterium]|nr:hypothetical protein [Alphaproteobacteria bacterium]
MKKILMVSFVTLLAGVGSGHAAIPSTEYVNQGLATKVDDTQIMTLADSAPLATSAGTVHTGGTVSEEIDDVVPSVNTVAQHFVPNIAPTVYNRGGVTNVNPDDLPDGSYSLIVEVKDGKITYRWVALAGYDACDTSQGYMCPL